MGNNMVTSRLQKIVVYCIMVLIHKTLTYLSRYNTSWLLYTLNWPFFCAKNSSLNLELFFANESKGATKETRNRIPASLNLEKLNKGATTETRNRIPAI